MKGSLQMKNKPLTGSVQAKGGKLYVVLNTYTDGKREPTWIPTGLDAKGNLRKANQIKNQLIQDYERERLEPVKRVAKRLFIEDIMDWLERKKSSLEQSSWESYEVYATKHLIPYFRKLKLSIEEITPKHLKQYYHVKMTKGNLKTNKGLSRDSVTKHASVLRMVFDDAMEAELVERNPAAMVKVPPKSVEESETATQPVFLIMDEANQLLESFRGNAMRPLIYVALYYGLRKSEILGLKWNAVDFDSDSFSIQHTVVKNRSIVAKDRTKSAASHGAYVLLPEVKEVLLELRGQQKEYRKFHGKAYEESGYIFTWPDGRLYRPDYVTRAFQKGLKMSGLKPMRFHDLWHSCASILYDKGWNVKDIQEWMRHADIETTMNIYTHISEQRKKLLAKDLQNTFHR